jgi:hypothetical protein
MKLHEKAINTHKKYRKYFYQPILRVMLSGNYIPLEVREIVYNFHLNGKRIAEEIFAELYLYDLIKISFRWLQDLCRHFDSDDEKEISEYLSSTKSRKLSAGRPQNLSNDAKE